MFLQSFIPVTCVSVEIMIANNNVDEDEIYYHADIIMTKPWLKLSLMTNYKLSLPAWFCTFSKNWLYAAVAVDIAVAPSSTSSKWTCLNQFIFTKL